ncbi:MAG: nucleoside-triphosphatase [Candidatus Hodarchaeales archaeon]
MRTRRPSFIITGPRRAGKSTLCMQILQYLRNHRKDAGGVITTQNSSRWIYLVQADRKIRFEARIDEECIKVGKFRVHKENMQQAVNDIIKSLENEYLFIDEIGILEMNKGGFYPALEKAFSRREGNMFVIRESILEEILDSYEVRFDFHIIRVANRQNKASFDLITSEIDKYLS